MLKELKYEQQRLIFFQEHSKEEIFGSFSIHKRLVQTISLTQCLGYCVDKSKPFLYN